MISCVAIAMSPLTFNTKKVRLKPPKAPDRRLPTGTFQYQKGAIKTFASSRASLARTDFQYQKGAIKTAPRRSASEGSNVAFNTKKVRLKRTIEILNNIVDLPFNTKKVRLKRRPLFW